MDVCFKDTFFNWDTQYALCIHTSVGNICVKVPLAERGVKPPEFQLENMREVLRQWLKKRVEA